MQNNRNNIQWSLDGDLDQTIWAMMSSHMMMVLVLILGQIYLSHPNHNQTSYRHLLSAAHVFNIYVQLSSML